MRNFFKRHRGARSCSELNPAPDRHGGASELASRAKKKSTSRCPKLLRAEPRPVPPRRGLRARFSREKKKSPSICGPRVTHSLCCWWQTCDKCVVLRKIPRTSSPFGVEPATQNLAKSPAKSSCSCPSPPSPWPPVQSPVGVTLGPYFGGGALLWRPGACSRWTRGRTAWP